MAAGDAPALQVAQRAFQQAMRKHIADIRDKYIVPGETAESALMFLPSEAIYAELHANFAGLVEESYRARVWIVSPTTMMATLNTVRAVLKDVRMREQAGEIQKTVGLMLEDVRRLDDRVDKLKTPLRADREGPARHRHLDRPHHQARPAHPRRRSRRGAGAAEAADRIAAVHGEPPREGSDMSASIATLKALVRPSTTTTSTAS